MYSNSKADLLKDCISFSLVGRKLLAPKERQQIKYKVQNTLNWHTRWKKARVQSSREAKILEAKSEHFYYQSWGYIISNTEVKFIFGIYKPHLIWQMQRPKWSLWS